MAAFTRLGMPQIAEPYQIQRGGGYRTHALRSDSYAYSVFTPPIWLER